MFMILLSSGLLILLLMILRPLMRKWVSPVVQYSLWLLVALRLLLPFQFGESPLSLENLFPNRPSSQVEEQPQTSDVINVQEQSPMTPHNPSVQEPTLSLPDGTPSTISLSPEGYVDSISQPTGVPSAESPSPVPMDQAVSTSHPLTGAQILFFVWFAGFLAMAAWFLSVNIRFHKEAKRNAKRLDIPHCPLPVYETRSIPSPCLMGLFRPRIFLLPQGDPDQQKHILTHEYTHYRHRDHIWSFLRGLCLCVYWFNPLVWVAAYLSKEDCELACDYSAINALGEEERLPYGRTLLDTLVQANRPGNLLCSATTMGSGKKQLRTRIEHIVSKPKKLLWALVSLLLIVALSVGCTFTGGKEPTHPSTEEGIETTTPTEDDTSPEATTPTGGGSSPEATATEEAGDPTENPHMIIPADVELIDGWFADVITTYEADGYTIPRLVIETEYGEQVNQEILDRFGGIIEGNRSQYTGLTYNWYLTVLEHFDPSPEVLVLDITATTVQGATEKLTYYVDLAYGAELSATGYASNIQYRVSRELVQELYDEYTNTGKISFTSEDRDIYLENLTRSYKEATFALTEQGTLAITIPYITLGGSIRDIPMSCEPTESISVNAFHEPEVMELYTYTSNNGTKNTIPFILLESVRAKEINAMILDNYLALQPNHVVYTGAVNGDILSFSIQAEDPYTYGLMCHAENFYTDPTMNGTPDTEYVLGQANVPMTYEEYEKKAQVLLPSYFFDLFPGITEQFPNDKMVLRQVIRCGSSVNLSLSTPYLDEEGNVWTYAYIYQIAGSSNLPHLIPISTGTVNEEYLAFAKANNFSLTPEETLLNYLQCLYGEGDYNLIYTSEIAYPEYVDDNIYAEAYEDHILIGFHRELLPTLTEQDLADIPELKAAADFLDVSELYSAYPREGVADSDIITAYSMIIAGENFTNTDDRYVELVFYVTTNQVFILIYPGL